MQTKNQVSEIQAKIKALEVQKASLVAKNGKGTITKDEQELLNKLAVDIIDLEESIEAPVVPAAKAEVKDEAYKVSKAEQGLYHVLVSKGSKFDPETGKPLNVPFMQKYTKVEYRQVEATAASMGITLKVIHEPIKD